MARRKVYLEDIPLADALARWYGVLDQDGLARPVEGERVSIWDALGRVTAEPVWAKLSNPHYHGSAMDGAAVRAVDTLGASEATPVLLTLGSQAHWVDTGDPMPADTNAVVMIEHIQTIGEDQIELMAPVAPWHHVRAMGEDIVATELVIPAGKQLAPVDLGAIAACGHTDVVVRRRPKVAVLPTGSEIVEPGSAVRPGDIIDFNSVMLCAQIREWGAEATRFPITPDDFELLKSRVEEALASHDIVVINAGSSAGSEDYTSNVVEALGSLLIHGVAIRPGHPQIMGICRQKPVLGIPGYPVSAALNTELFVKPLVYRLLGAVPPGRPKMAAVVSRKVLSPMGEDEYMRVKVGRVGERVVATPLARGAGVIMSLVRADGIVRVPRLSEGMHAGAEVEVDLLRSPEEVNQTIVAIGSHDLTLDLLSSRLSAARPGASLSSSNAGSLGGIIALQRGEAHLAGSHLLDEQSGEYNVDYVRRMLAGRRIVVMTLTQREQGLIVPKSNPKAISRLDDLARPDVLFINRQKGAGTRVLLDYRLRQMGLDPLAINGYEREEYTHLMVAAAVAGGSADVGLGILAAARALDLDFVPLLQERYDLLIPAEFYASDLLAPLLQIIRGEEFRREVEALGGYDCAEMGRVVAEL